MKLVDLHVHSTCSDGTLTPSELVSLAKKTGLSAFALTDHDTVKGLPEAMEAGKKEGIEVLPGIEFSTEYKGKDIHIVGLEFDPESPVFYGDPAFSGFPTFTQPKMIEKLHDEGGIDISWNRCRKPSARQYGPEPILPAIFWIIITSRPCEASTRWGGDTCPLVPRERSSWARQSA